MRLSPAVVLSAFVFAACGGGGGTDSPTVTTLALSPGSIDTLFSRGQTVQLTVQAKDAGGNVINRPSLSYNTGNANVATVSNTGLITAQGNGKTNITVASGSVSQAVEVNVRRKIVTITVSPSSRTLAPAATQALTVRAFDAQNNEVTGAGVPTFGSSNTGVATVNGTGTVTAVALGDATITATLVTVDGTRTATSAITVSNQTAPNAATVALGAQSFDPSIVDITAGGQVTWTNGSGVQHNVTFVASTIADIGNHTTGSNARTFPSAGTFDYQCTLHAGMTGSVIVH